MPPRLTAATVPAWTPQLVALDLDGTTVTADLTIHPRVIAAVTAAAARIPVVVATGRMYRSAAPWAQRLGVTAPLICYQGGLVRDLPGSDGTPGAVRTEHLLDPASACAALLCAREHDWHRQAFVNDEVLCEEDRPEAQIYGATATVTYRRVDDLVEVTASGCSKIVFVIPDAAEVERSLPALDAVLGPPARVVRSRADFVEVTSSSATKSRALAEVCDLFGADIARSVAVGDAPNDTDMLQAAGLGVAIEGSAPGVLRAASAVCAGPADGGVADVLDALGLI